MKEYFENLVKEKVFPGCNYAIIYQDKIEINSVGNKSLIPEIEKNDLDTLYDIASLTKILVTSTILTKLLQQNKISLNDKVCKYLEKFKYPEMTLLHLVTHTSGLISNVDWSKVKNKQELIEFFYNKELEHKIGTKLVYSDINFIFFRLYN